MINRILERFSIYSTFSTTHRSSSHFFPDTEYHFTAQLACCDIQTVRSLAQVIPVSFPGMA